MYSVLYTEVYEIARYVMKRHPMYLSACVLYIEQSTRATIVFDRTVADTEL